MQVSRTAMKWTGLLVLLLLGLASAVFAQPHTSRGGALKKKAYQTYAAMTLYVDPTGSDSNSCTASGTSACLTLGGALLKVPIHIRHLVTINVATGTYTEVFRVQGFFIEGANGAASTAALTIAGTQTAFTVVTGSNTGTLTGFTAGAAGTHPIATDSTQTWTINDLKGRFLQITGGTGSGTYIPIVSNTATTISYAANVTTAPVAGSTYAIVTPGPVFTGANAGLEGNIGGGLVTVSDISFQPAAGAAMATSSGSTTNRFTLTRVRAIGASTGFSFSTSSVPTLIFNQSVFQGGTASGLLLPQNSIVTASQIFVNCSGTCTGFGVLTSPRNGFLSSFSATVAGDFQTAMFRLQSPSTMQSVGIWFDCASASNIAINTPAAVDSANYAVSSGWAQNTGPFINGCGTGYSINTLSASYIDNGTVFTNVTNAITLTAGARAIVEAGITFTGVTNQLTIDSTVYTDADLTTFTRITGPQGSYATRP